MASSKAHVIFHIDMNMFFCSVAVIKNPSLKGKAFVCGRTNTTKGVVSTASYEARKLGIHSAMPMVEALRIKKDGHASISLKMLENKSYYIIELPSVKLRVFLDTDYTYLLREDVLNECKARKCFN
jgi:nucleotidyltransferase/DNA polymerase involved in DNA repair